MKIGILQTDSVLDKFKASFGDYPQMFELLFKRARPGLHCVTYNVANNHYPTVIDECDAYVITGSKASVYEELEWIRVLEDYIRQLHQAEKKLLAVCFGHQLVAQTFGGKTEKSNKGWGVGVHSIAVLKHKPWMLPPLKHYNIIASHQDQVTQLPEGAELLAGTDFCPHAMFQYGSILTIQGHPEFRKDYANAAMQNRRERIEAHHYEAAMNSWNTALDEDILARWLLQFIETKG